MEETPEATEPAPEKKSAPAPLPKFLKFGDEEIPYETVVEERKRIAEYKAQAEEAAQVRQQTESFIRKLRENPTQGVFDLLVAATGDEELSKKELLKHFGKYVDEAWQLEQMPEADRRAMEFEKKLKAAQGELDTIKAQREDHFRAQQEIADTRQVLSEVSGAIKETGLPQQPKIIRAIAEVLYVARKNGKQLSPVEAAKHVKAELRSQLEERLKELDADPSGHSALLGLFPNLSKKLRESDVDKVKRSLSKPPAAKAGTRKTESGEVQPKIYRDFEDLLNRK